MEKKITVTGRGSVHVVPDITRLTTSVGGHFETYEEAYDEAQLRLSWFPKILEYNKLSGKLAKTIRFDVSVATKSEYDKAGHYVGQIFDGYDIDIKVKIDIGMNTKLLNNIVRGIGKFIPGAEISIGYTTKDPRPSQLLMLERAVKDSHDKAEIMAKAAGLTLGEAVNITYNHEDVHIYSEARNIHSNAEAMACTSDSLDVTPDDLSVSDEVVVEWVMM